MLALNRHHGARSNMLQTRRELAAPSMCYQTKQEYSMSEPDVNCRELLSAKAAIGSLLIENTRILGLCTT